MIGAASSTIVRPQNIIDRTFNEVFVGALTTLMWVVSQRSGEVGEPTFRNQDYFKGRALSVRWVRNTSTIWIEDGVWDVFAKGGSSYDIPMPRRRWCELTRQDSF